MRIEESKAQEDFPIKILALLIAGLFYSNLAFSKMSLESCNEFLVEIQTKGTTQHLGFGAPVTITINHEKQMEAYFLGENQAKLFFTLKGEKRLLDTIFTINRSDATISNKIFINGDGAEGYLDVTPEVLIKTTEQEQIQCLPTSVMACLRRLDEGGGLPKMLSQQMQSFPEELLDELKEVMGPEGAEIGYTAYNEANPRNRFSTLRAFQHFRLQNYLETKGIKVEKTDSVSKLLKHLKDGLPAVISVSATYRSKYIHDLSTLGDLNEHPDFYDRAHRGSHFPVPTWVPGFGGYHAVYAYSALKSDSLLLGKRIVIWDFSSNMVNTWSANYLRAINERVFFLLSPSQIKGGKTLDAVAPRASQNLLSTHY